MSNQVLDGDSLRSAREALGLTQSELADASGIGFATLGRWERGETVPRPKQARAVVETLRRLQDGGPSAMLGPRSLDDIALIPRVCVEASAGGGLAVHEESVEQWLGMRRDWLRGRGVSPDQCVALTCKGDSMRPELLDGDVLFVDRSQTGVTGRDAVFVLRLYDAVMVKRLRKTPDGILVTSVNPEYPPMTIGSDKLDFAVLGRVFSVARSYL